MGLKEWLIPQEKKFFHMLIEQARKIDEGVLLSQSSIKHIDAIEENRKKLKKIEHEADKIVHIIFSELDRSFITPIDREDISELTSRLDDIIDSSYAAINRLYLYKLQKITPEMIEFSNCLVKAVTQIVNSLSLLPNLKNSRKMADCCIEINRIENHADEVMNSAMLNLFKNNDPITIIQMKEIYDFLENAIDRCEDVADVIKSILIKHG